MRIKANVTPEIFAYKVFGGECFIEQFPQLFDDGIDVEFIGEFYYIVDASGRKVGDTHFFSQEELDAYFVKN